MSVRQPHRQRSPFTVHLSRGKPPLNIRQKCIRVVRQLHDDERIDRPTLGDERGTQLFALLPGLRKQVVCMRLAFREHHLGREIGIDVDHLLDESFGDDVLFLHLDQDCIGVLERRRRGADDLVRLEELDNGIGLFGKVLMAFVDDDLERHT